MMKVLIFEDEIPAKNKLVKLIGTVIPNASIVGWARSIVEAKDLLDTEKNIDLVFSDIELLDGTAFEVFESQTINCPIIFSTAFDHYMLQAFQSSGIAYLLKPYNLKQFEEAFAKYERLFAERKGPNLDRKMMTELRALVNQQKRIYKNRFTIKKRDGIKLLNVEDIVSFEASGDFSFAFDSKGDKHLINLPLGEIEQKVSPRLFFRINRSEMIQLSYIESMEPHFKNRLSIQLVNRDKQLLTSSTKTAEYRIWLEG